MITGIVLGCYVLGFIIAARVYVATSNDSDRGEARFNGTLVGFLWPLALLIIAIAGLLSLPTLGVKTKAERQVRAREAEWERRRMAARIAELEREAEIRP